MVIDPVFSVRVVVMEWKAPGSSIYSLCVGACRASSTVLAYYIWCRRAVLPSGLRGGKGDRGEARRRGARRCTLRTPPCVAHRARCAVQLLPGTGPETVEVRLPRTRTRTPCPEHGAPDEDEDLTQRAPDEQQLSVACGRGRFPRAARARRVRTGRARSGGGGMHDRAAKIFAVRDRDMDRYASENEGGMARGGARFAGQTAARCCISHCRA